MKEMREDMTDIATGHIETGKQIRLFVAKTKTEEITLMNLPSNPTFPKIRKKGTFKFILEGKNL